MFAGWMPIYPVFNFQVFTKPHISRLFGRCKTGTRDEQVSLLMILKNICDNQPSSLVDFFSTLCDPSVFKQSSLEYRSYIIACIGRTDQVRIKVDLLFTFDKKLIRHWTPVKRGNYNPCTFCLFGMNSTIFTLPFSSQVLSIYFVFFLIS